MEHIKQFKEMLEKLANPNGVSEMERGMISDSVDSFVKGIKKELTNDDWFDSKGNLNVGVDE